MEQKFTPVNGQFRGFAVCIYVWECRIKHTHKLIVVILSLGIEYYVAQVIFLNLKLMALVQENFVTLKN